MLRVDGEEDLGGTRADRRDPPDEAGPGHHGHARGHAGAGPLVEEDRPLRVGGTLADHARPQFATGGPGLFLEEAQRVVELALHLGDLVLLVLQGRHLGAQLRVLALQVGDVGDGPEDVAHRRQGTADPGLQRGEDGEHLVLHLAQRPVVALTEVQGDDGDARRQQGCQDDARPGRPSI